MKKLYFTLSVFFLAIVTVNGQEVNDSDHHIEVVDSQGREVVVISSGIKEASGFSLSVAGMKFDFEKNKENGKDRPRGYISSGSPEIGFICLTKPDYSIYPQGTPNFMDLDNARSISFTLDLAVVKIPLNYSRKLIFDGGFKLKWDNYVFSDRITISKQNGMVQPVPLDMNKYKKSKLTVFSLNIPIMLKYNLTELISIGGGVYGDLTLGHHTKVKFPKDKNRENLGLNFFNAGVRAQIGIGWFYLYGTYNFTPLFKSGIGPKTQPFTIGIRIGH